MQGFLRSSAATIAQACRARARVTAVGAAKHVAGRSVHSRNILASPAISAASVTTLKYQDGKVVRTRNDAQMGKSFIARLGGAREPERMINDDDENETITATNARKPSKEDAELMPRYYSEMSNAVIYKGIAQTNKSSTFVWLCTLPYKTGICIALTAGLSSFPMVFHRGTVEWFNRAYVTTDEPEEKDLETWLEVGSWAWNWMEPPLGQISFFLLCLQFARNQVVNLQRKPFTQMVQDVRAQLLCERYPTYNKSIVRDFATTDEWTAPNNGFIRRNVFKFAKFVDRV